MQSEHALIFEAYRLRESKNSELSRHWASKTSPTPKACWVNALKALKKSRDPKLMYVEGFVRLKKLGNLVIEHGWLEHADGYIIDTTLVDDDVDYFPGVKYSLEAVLRMGRKVPPFVWGGENGWGGFGNTAYKSAHDTAWGEHFKKPS